MHPLDEQLASSKGEERRNRRPAAIWALFILMKAQFP
jgi:hypothetical protein